MQRINGSERLMIKIILTRATSTLSRPCPSMFLIEFRANHLILPDRCTTSRQICGSRLAPTGTVGAQVVCNHKLPEHLCCCDCFYDMCLDSPSKGGWWFIQRFLAFLNLLKWDRLTIWLFYHQIPDKRLQRVDDQATSFKTKQYKVWNDNCLFWIAEELSRGRQKSNIRGPWYDVHVWYVRTKRCWVS